MEVFQLVKHGNFGYSDVLNMPRVLRKRYHKKLMDQYQEELKAMEKSTGGSDLPS